ncbi:MAG: hypothetical protein WA397_06455 [Roseiarcus sp.]
MLRVTFPILIGEEVLEADVLRFALDGHLTLSVDFVNPVTAQCGKIIPYTDAEIREVPNPFGGDGVKLIKDGVHVEHDRVFSYTKAITELEGIWNLAMVGADRIDVERRYQILTGGPTVDSISLFGPFVYSEDGRWAQLLKYFSKDKLSFVQNKLHDPRSNPDNYYPAGSLPSDVVLVVRTSALQELERLFSDPEPATERPVGRRERMTLLVIIAALAKRAKIDVTKPSSAATAIESQTSLLGARVAARTIENHLKRIPEALENKSE